jgi:hypothetical protein
MAVEIYELLGERGCAQKFQKSRRHLKIPGATLQNLVATATMLQGFGQPCTTAYRNILGYFYENCILWFFHLAFVSVSDLCCSS